MIQNDFLNGRFKGCLEIEDCDKSGMELEITWIFRDLLVINFFFQVLELSFLSFLRPSVSSSTNDFLALVLLLKVLFTFSTSKWIYQS